MTDRRRPGRSGRIREMTALFQRTLSVFGCILLLAPLLLSGSDFSVGGYWKSFFVALDLPDFSLSGAASIPDRWMGLANNRLRLHASADFSPRLRGVVAYDISPRIQDSFLFRQDIFLVSVDPYVYRMADLEKRLYPREKYGPESFAVFQNLDRLVLSVATEPADIYIGRQAISWGSARVVNPTDILAPFALQELDKEERVGVDAVRVRIPIGFMGEIDAGYVFGKDFCFENSAFFLRGKTYTAKTDVSFLCLGFQKNLLIGADIARSIGGAGFWMEGAYVFARLLGKRRSGSTDDYFRLSTGLDYSLSGKTYGFIEYHFNSGGASSPDNYIPNLANPVLAEGAVFLLGKHYLIPGLNHQITPLIILTAEILINLSDGSFFMAPVVEYNLAPSVYISAGGFLGFGSAPASSHRTDAPTAAGLRSEFGSYSDALYTSFKIYF